jgi:hypothetical protein
MPEGWVSASCGSGVRATDHRPELCRGGSWCYDITCAVQQVSYSRRLFHTTCPADTQVPLLRRAHAEQPQPGPGAFYRNRLRGRQRGWRRRCAETRSLIVRVLDFDRCRPDNDPGHGCGRPRRFVLSVADHGRDPARPANPVLRCWRGGHRHGDLVVAALMDEGFSEFEARARCRRPRPIAPRKPIGVPTPFGTP